MRLHLPSAKGKGKIIVRIYYQSLMRLQGPSFVEDLNKLDCKSKAHIGAMTAATFKCMTPSNVHGPNRFDRSEGMLEIVVAAHDPDSFIEIRSMPVVSVSMGVSTLVDNFYKVKDSFLSNLAFTLGIDVNRITIVDVVAGNARRQALPSIPSHASDRSLLSSRNLLAASTTVKFEVEPSPQIDLKPGDITVLEDVEVVNIILERSVNIHGKCGVAFTVTNRSADSAVPGENFQTDPGFVTFESKEVTKSIEVQVLRQSGYTAQFCASLSRLQKPPIHRQAPQDQSKYMFKMCTCHPNLRLNWLQLELLRQVLCFNGTPPRDSRPPTPRITRQLRGKWSVSPAD